MRFSVHKEKLFRRCAAALCCMLALFCSAKGPPFRGRGGVPAEIAGRFSFVPPLPFYAVSVGEVTFSRQKGRTDFILRIAGLTRKRHLVLEGQSVSSNQEARIRHYEGRAFAHNGLIELRPRRCYEFGRAHIEARQSPLRGWSCDHLLFAFKNNLPEKLESLTTKETRFTDWMGRFDLLPLPVAALAAQVLQMQPDQRILAFGSGAGRTLKLKSRMQMQNGTSYQVESVPGDFILLSGPPAAQGATLLSTDKPSILIAPEIF
jgi:hypothetical protein